MWSGCRLICAALVASLVSCACRRDADSVIRIDGSSTVFPVSAAVAEEFHSTHRERAAVAISGTGGGFKKFCSGEIDISDASRPIKPSEVTLCERNAIQYVEVPIGYDGIVVVTNPANDWAKDVTVAELKKIWEPGAEGVVTRWSQVREGWPDRELHLFGAGSDSGTYDYFTHAIVGVEESSRKDFTSSENDDVIVKSVAKDELALGFFGFSYYANSSGKLKALPIDDQIEDNGAGPIAPSVATVRDATYQPLSRPIFIYVSAPSLNRPEVAQFMEFYLQNAARLVAEADYVALPPRAYELGLERVQRRRTGSVFGGKGSQVGVSIDQLLEKESAE